ncbi:hypothetical protein Xcel_0091 [Xylanimonas cellulosilytica DSM 15894]|uniref:Coenzyme PQQ synthesis D n=1 Tax=Xylanimonas cellulosilytica (strain DSM 15894 / JCM 12276 / CECT 5975 / KCTC 9989 / LMG 20990 / NBRC 107835 / XIL07) TaxID=446471 RepID=D1BTW8_XYLCX|nr:lasso peptide biosynthesis PqqD family chaperone [Xylanimonas cellulosilytica]ACZ29132.1 hypothetical protein Xcel_0091 [Xylanimonas cellulosilytica DSM 15894]
MRLKEGLEIVDVEDGRVLLDSRKGVYWHLNASAIGVLEALAQGRTVDDVVRDVVRQTGADEAVVRADHVELVRELRKARLITGEPS